MSEAVSKAIRLIKIREMLKTSKSAREIAEITGVCERTINRDLLDLQIGLRVPIIKIKNKYKEAKF